MKAELFDLAVIGAGPAGAAAAITAAGFGARVLLLEAGEFPRHKVCGEFVSAESLAVLAGLLEHLPEAQRALRDAPVISGTRLFMSGRVLEAAVSPAALSLPRFALDALLWETAKVAGVEARSRCEVLSRDRDGPFTVMTSQGEFGARAVILASGRWSRFSDKLGGTPGGPKWIGVKAHFHERNPPNSTDLYFFEHGYCGVQPVGGSVVNACAMVRSDRATSLDEVLRLSPELQARTSGWSPLMEPVTTAPLIYRTPTPVRGELMLVGDAAGFIDPFVGDGISIALRSGRAAAVALGRFVRGEVSLDAAALQYESVYRSEFAPLLSAASKVRGLLTWPPFARLLAFETLRLPGVMPYVIRKTRRA